MEEPARPARRPNEVKRGEGELASWPRGFVAYVPARPEPERSLAEEEDRTAQRLELAGRLIAVLAARGEPVDDLLRRLARLREGWRSRPRAEVDRAVDALLGELGERAEAEPTARGQR